MRINRRSFAIAAAGVIASVTKLTAQTFGFAYIVYGMIYPEDYGVNPDAKPTKTPVMIGFTARRSGTVYKLTEEIFPLKVSERFADYVEDVGGHNLGLSPGWNYYVNGQKPQTLAKTYTVSPGVPVEWRLGNND